jgi:hypothetical protein
MALITIIYAILLICGTIAFTPAAVGAGLILAALS